MRGLGRVGHRREGVGREDRERQRLPQERLLHRVRRASACRRSRASSHRARWPAAPRASARGPVCVTSAPSRVCPSSAAAPAAAARRARRPARCRTAGPAGSASSRRTRRTPRADTGSGSSSRSTIASSSPWWTRTAARLIGDEPAARRAPAARSIRAIDAASCSRASMLVSSLQRQESSGEQRSRQIADDQAVDRRPQLCQRAPLVAGARQCRERERRAPRSQPAPRGTSGTKARSSATSASATSGAAERAGRGRSIGWPGPNSETWLRVTMRSR